MEYLFFRDLPAGCNCVVAIACFTGYNQEDSIMFNQSSVDRGLMRSVFYRTYDEELRDDRNAEEEFCKPTSGTTSGLHALNYAKLDHDGLIFPGQRVSGEDVIIGKVSKFDKNRTDLGKNTQKDSSVRLRRQENGIVDQVLITYNGEGKKLAKVRSRNVRIPQVGDKFARFLHTYLSLLNFSL